MAALLAAQGDKVGRLVLCRHDADVTLLVAANEKLRIMLFTVPVEATPEIMCEWFATTIKLNATGGPELHIVAVGGDTQVADALKKGVPARTSVSLGCHHLAASGELVPLSARELPLLRAAQARADVQPLAPEQLAAALAEGQVLQQATKNLGVGLRGSYRVTAAITVVCVVLMALELWWMSAGKLSVFAAMGANGGIALQDGEIWRLFASAFLHGDIMHLIVNMVALWSFGILLESLLGPRRYLLLYGLSALGGSLASAFLGSAAWSVGASGAIWGLMAAGIAITYWPRGLLPPVMLTQLRKRVWMPLLLNLAYSFQPGIDVYAHLGGGVVGFALIAGLLTRDLRPVAERAHPSDAERGPNPAITRGALALGLAMALSIAVALATGRPWALNAALVFQRTAIGDTGFSAELPDRIAKVPRVEEMAGMRMFAFGDLRESAVVFEFIVIPLPQEILARDVDKVLEIERKAFDQASPPEFTRVAPAELILVGGRPAVLVDFKLNDLSLRNYLILFSRHEVLMRRYVLGELPPVWAGAEQTIAASLGHPSEKNAPQSLLPPNTATHF